MGKGNFSLLPQDAVEGGGTEGALATIQEIEFVDEFTYGGRQKDKPQAALRVVYAIDGFDKPWEQHYSVGPSERYEVVDDGDGIKALGKNGGLNKRSSCYRFFDALVTAAEAGGLDLEDLLPELDEGSQSIRKLEGMRVRLTNVKYETVGGDTKEMIVIGTFEGDDDEKPAKGSKGGKATGSKGSKSKGADVETKAEEAIVALLDEKSPRKKSTLPNDIFQAHKKDADVKAMMNLAFKDAWLYDEDRPWESDKKKGTIALADDEDDD